MASHSIAIGTAHWELTPAWPMPLPIVVGLWFAALAFVCVGLMRERVPWPRKALLAGLRIAVISGLVLMLGRWHWEQFDVQKPDLIVIADNSLSMTLPAGNASSDSSAAGVNTTGDDASGHDVSGHDASDADAASDDWSDEGFRVSGDTRWRQALRLSNEHNWMTRLKQRYRVKVFAVDESLRSVETLDEITSQGTQSRLGDALVEVANRQQGQSTAAILLLSDGMVTGGLGLNEAATRLAKDRLPLWSVGLGSEQPPPDLAIREITAPDRVMLGDTINVTVMLSGQSVTRQEATVLIRERRSGKVIASRTLQVDGAELSERIDLTATADHPGRQDWTVDVRPIAGELITQNNRRSLSFTVRDEPLGTLLIARQPSYEFRFLKHLLERATGQGPGRQRLIELTSVLQEGDPRYAKQDRFAAPWPPVSRDELNELDVVILCDADIDQLGDLMMQQLDDLVRSVGVGLVVVAGPMQDLGTGAAATTLAGLLPAQLAGKRSAIGGPNGNQPATLTLTPLGQRSPALGLPSGMTWPAMPAIYTSLECTVKPSAAVLLSAEPHESNARNPGNRVDAGGVWTTPVVMTQSVGAGRVWLQTTDESFRWTTALADENLHERYWLQVLRHVAKDDSPGDSDVPQLNATPRRVTVGQPVEIQLQTGQGPTIDAASVVMEDDRGKRRAVSLAPDSTPTRLQAHVDDLPPGHYNVELISPTLAPMPDPIAIEVTPPDDELRETRAALAVLDGAARATGGAMLTADQAARELLERLPPGQTLRLRSTRSTALWNHWLSAAILLGLLCAEWGLRWRWGL